jgi:hypothetical protein
MGPWEPYAADGGLIEEVVEELASPSALSAAFPGQAVYRRSELSRADEGIGRYIKRRGGLEEKPQHLFGLQRSAKLLLGV